ncbi:hypothetical protein AGMMS50230_12750 [Spirochaetia bacterium]|nr:hypothetical protein AGMMS50230_12750 [Spirochaetia bacterium]
MSASETMPGRELLEAWSLVEAALQGQTLETLLPDPVLVSAVTGFRQSLKKLSATPLYAEYVGKGFVEDREDMVFLAASLETAVKTGNRAEIIRVSGGIREKVMAWQRMELNISGRAFVRLLNFFIVFILIFCGLVLLIELLRRALRRSRLQEEDSAAFSRLIMLAQETERSRIAGELHDTVLQDMGQLLRVSGRSGELLDLQRRIMDKIRAVCLDLLPPDFSRLALPDALTRLCIDFTKRTGVECRSVILPGFTAEAFRPEAQLQIYRIAQEALMNIEKHAHAAEVTLSARNETEGGKSSILMCISDDGKGLPPRLPSDRLGIQGMRKRAALLGADLSFVGGPGSGLTVRLEIPSIPIGIGGGGYF